MSEIKKRQTSDSFRLALLLTLSGGFLESYTYVTRDKVFANAQTGNVIRLAMGISELDLVMIIRYLMPIIAFIIGINLSSFLRLKYKNNKKIHWRQIVLIIEIVVLLLVSQIEIGKVTNVIANVLVAFTCSIQYEAFKKFEGNPFSSLFCTGNLRNFSEQLFFAISKKDYTHLQKCKKYLIIILTFMTGVIVGKFATSWIQQYSCIIPAVILFGVMLLMLKENID